MWSGHGRGTARGRGGARGRRAAEDTRKVERTLCAVCGVHSLRFRYCTRSLRVTVSGSLPGWARANVLRHITRNLVVPGRRFAAFCSVTNISTNGRHLTGGADSGGPGWRGANRSPR